MKTRFLILLPAMLLLMQAAAYSQTEPEAPASVLRPGDTKNGWQISLYGGVSYNEYYEGYDIKNVISFIADETSWNMPLGLGLNIPIFEELSLYVRAGAQNMETNFFNGQIDSIKSTNDLGYIGYDMDFSFDIFHLDILIRLIGENEGERVYFGPSFGYVQKRHITVKRTELETGEAQLLQDQAMPGSDNFFPTFVIGGEYAFIPMKNLYLIPAIEVNFGWEKISNVQRLRTNYYRLLFNISYQIF
jgi:hypothetical protein